ncbi:MAG: class E sortase [Nocardioides sp.]
MRGRIGVAGAVTALLASACSEPRVTTPTPSPAPNAPSVSAAAPSSEPSPDPAPEPEPAAEAEAETTAPPTRSEPRRSFLTIPRLGLEAMPVVRYRGRPDDAPGTAIQNRGPTASPRGPGGGVGPGLVGNFIVTGHRTSHSAPFADLPALDAGDRVRVRARGTVFVYEITRTRQTSFRSPASLARQAAAVPGRPGARPVEAMITLSTCATPEDHAAGNFWSDRFGNPEHRIDKIGVLIGTRQAR